MRQILSWADCAPFVMQLLNYGGRKHVRGMPSRREVSGSSASTCGN